MSTSSRSLFGGCGTIAAVLIVTVFVLLLVLGVAIQIGFVPDSATLPAGKIPSRLLDKLQELGITREGEEVLYFYSAAILDIRGDGNLFTNERVISYEEIDGELQIYEAAYDEIEAIEFSPSDNWLDDSTIDVTTKDESSWFVLVVSRESNGDQQFYDRLVEEWNKHRPAAGAAEAATP